MIVDFLKIESGKFREGIKSVNTRKSDWENFETKAMDWLNNICTEVQNEKLIAMYALSTKNLPQENNNWKFVQLSFASNFTGYKDFREGDTKGQLVVESGCSLCYSQGMDGKVTVVLYPYKSALSEPLKEYYVYSRIDPSKLSEKRIETHIKILFSYAHYTSIFGFPDWMNYMRYTWLRIVSKYHILWNSDWLEYIPSVIKTIAIASKAIAPHPG